MVSSSWKKENGKIILEVKIPANTRAAVHIPTSNKDSIREAQTLLKDSKDVVVKSAEDNYAVVEVGSGSYRFEGELR